MVGGSSKTQQRLLARRPDFFDGCGTGFGDFFILCCAFGSAQPVISGCAAKFSVPLFVE